MSTRSSIAAGRWWHLFRDMTAPGIFLDLGSARRSYNRAWRVWPPTFKRLY